MYHVFLVLWLGVVQFGLAQQLSWTSIKDASNPASNFTSVNDMLVSSRGELWIASNSGVFRYKDGIWNSWTGKMTHEYNIDQKNAGTIEEDKNGDIWVGWRTFFRSYTIYEVGASRYNGGWSQFLFGKEVHNLHRGKSGKLYATYRRHGIGISNGNTSFGTYGMISGLLSNIVSGVIEDNSGNAWITYGSEKAITRRSPTGTLTHFRESEISGLSFGIRDLMLSQDGTVWFLAGDKLQGYNGQSWSIINLPMTYSRVLEDHNGLLLFINSRGISLYDKKNWVHYRQGEDIPGMPNQFVFTENSASFYLATYNDVHKMHFDNAALITRVAESKFSNKPNMEFVVYMGTDKHTFQVSDLEVTNGVIEHPKTVSDINGYYRITVIAVAEGEVTVSMPENKFQIHNQSNLASRSASFVYDITPPVLSVVSPDTTKDYPFEVKIRSNEKGTRWNDSNDYKLSNIHLLNGRIESSYSDTSLTLRVYPDSIGEVIIQIGDSAALDAAGNYSSGLKDLKVEYKGRDPKIVIWSDEEYYTNKDTIAIYYFFGDGFYYISDIQNAHYEYGNVTDMYEGKILLMPRNEGIVSVTFGEETSASYGKEYSMSFYYDQTAPIADILYQGLDSVEIIGNEKLDTIYMDKIKLSVGHIKRIERVNDSTFALSVTTYGADFNLTLMPGAIVDIAQNGNRDKVSKDIVYEGIVTGSQEYLRLSETLIYPNPNKGTFVILTNENVMTYELFDELGVAIEQGMLSEKKISMRERSSGIYTLKLYTDNKVIVRKISVY